MIGTFIIPIGDLVFALREERSKETAAIEYILEELDKIIIDQGVMSYSLQEEIKDFDSESIKSTIKIETERLRNSIVAEAELKQPLLLNMDDLEDKRVSASPLQPLTPSRVTPKHLAQMGKSPMA